MKQLKDPLCPYDIQIHHSDRRKPFLCRSNASLSSFGCLIEITLTLFLPWNVFPLLWLSYRKIPAGCQQDMALAPVQMVLWCPLGRPAWERLDLSALLPLRFHRSCEMWRVGCVFWWRASSVLDRPGFEPALGTWFHVGFCSS